MDIIYINKRIINDVRPVMIKNKYKNCLDINLFINLCEKYESKELTNIQFRESINRELKKINT